MAPQNELSPEVIKKIESIIEYHMKKFGTPGCSIAVLKGDRTIYMRGFGKCEINKTKQIDKQTLFGIGSVSKSFTCLGIMLLQEDGKLSIDDPISKYLPIDLKGKEHKIKIKHLMSHSSGLPNIFLAFIIEKQLGYRKSYDSINLNNREIHGWEDLYAYLKDASEFITSNPGDRFHYSDTSFTLLSKIIEIASGKTHADFITERILNPLEMNQSQIRSNFDQNIDNIASGHFVSEIDGKESLVPVLVSYPFSELLNGGGGILSSTEDLTHYLTMIMNKGEYKGKQIIPQKIIDTVTTPITTVINSKTNDKTLGVVDFDRTDMGYGWVIQNNLFGSGKNRIFHLGNTGASSSYCGFVPNLKKGFLFFSNVSKIDFETLNLIFLALLEDIDVILPQKSLQDGSNVLVGDYQNVGGFSKLSVSIQDENLNLEGSVPDVNGIRMISGKLNHYPYEKKNHNQEYSFHLESPSFSLRTKVLFEKQDEKTFLTLGIDKFKKIK
jgi:CubicO group peptidase (beta-lactamase class C family)